MQEDVGKMMKLTGHARADIKPGEYAVVFRHVVVTGKASLNKTDLIIVTAAEYARMSIGMEQAAAAGREEAFHGPPDYTSRRAPSSLQQGRCGDACSPCAYGRTCKVPRVGLQSRALTLCLFISTRPRTGTRVRARATWRCALAYW